MNNSVSNTSSFLTFVLLERYYQNCRAVFAATGMNGLILLHLECTHDLTTLHIAHTIG